MFVHRWRQHVLHALACMDAAADEGGRNVNVGGVDQMDVARQVKGRCVVAGTRIDVQRVVLEDELGILPLGDIGQVVLAHDDAELLVGIHLFQLQQSVYRVGRVGEVKLHIAHSETGVVLHRQVHHVQPVVRLQQVLPLLERVVRRYDKPHLFQVAVLSHVFGNDQVADMDGVEGAEKESDFVHICLFLL